MSATAQPRTPRALQKRKLTISKAVEQWCETTLAIEGLKPMQEQAAEVLIAHARKTGRRTFKDRIAVTDTGGQLVLDQQAVKDALGERISEERFWKRAKRGLSLKLLQ